MDRRACACVHGRARQEAAPRGSTYDVYVPEPEPESEPEPGAESASDESDGGSNGEMNEDLGQQYGEFGDEERPTTRTR